MRSAAEPTAPVSIDYLQVHVARLWRDGYLTQQPAEEQVEVAPETLRLEGGRIMSGPVSRPAPEVRRLRSRFRGTTAGEGVRHE
jgi:hypothetical protein